MNLKATSVIGLDIISIDTGKKVETVTDILYDPKINKVIALLVDKKGWFKDARVILTHNIHSIGKDAVMILNENAIEHAEDTSERVATIAYADTTLVRDEVVTIDGTKLGSVSNLFFTLPGGNVTELEVSQGVLKDVNSGKKTIAVPDIVTIGENKIIVSKYTDVAFEEQGKEQGLQGALHTAQVKGGEILDKTKEVVSNTTATVVDKTKEVAHKVEEKAAPMIDKTKEVAVHAKEDFQSGKMKEDAKNTWDKTKEVVGGKVDQAKEAATSTKDKAQQEIQDKRKLGAIGKNVGDTAIIGLNDEVLAQPGQPINHDLIIKAELNGVLDTLLDNVVTPSKAPTVDPRHLP